MQICIHQAACNLLKHCSSRISAHKIVRHNHLPLNKMFNAFHSGNIYLNIEIIQS